jgi:hypothetical protein
MLGKRACRVRVAFGSYRVGDVIYPTGVYRDQLRARGLIEIEAAPVVEAAPAEETAEAVAAETAVRRRGRPRRTEAEV